MAAATSKCEILLEFHGALADRFAPLGHRRGTRTHVSVSLDASSSVADVLSGLAATDERYAFLFDRTTDSLPEHVEVVLNDRVLDLQGGVSAQLKDGDVLSFLPAHAGG
jgi:molybdopterin converting factor small subunit